MSIIYCFSRRFSITVYGMFSLLTPNILLVVQDKERVQVLGKGHGLLRTLTQENQVLRPSWEVTASPGPLDAILRDSSGPLCKPQSKSSRRTSGMRQTGRRDTGPTRPPGRSSRWGSVSATAFVGGGQARKVVRL